MNKKIEINEFYSLLDVQLRLLKTEGYDYRHLLLAILMKSEWIFTKILKEDYKIDYSTVYSIFINNKEYIAPDFSGEVELIIQSAKFSEEATLEECIMEDLFTACNKSMRQLFKKVNIPFDEVKQKYMEQFVINETNNTIQSFCTTMEPKNNIKEVLLRDEIIFNIYIALGKKTKSNAILYGDAGVGKTAIVEEIARQIHFNECPQEFKNYKVLNLDIVSALAGTRLRGEFEEKIKAFIDCMSEDNKYIVFIDEIQNMVGAGAGQDSKLDLSNMLKPLLARDNIRLIGATTVNELADIQKDKALARRFEYIEIDEPSVDKVFAMITNKVNTLSNYHQISYKKEDIESIIEYCNKMESTLCFPDKAIDVIDSLMSMSKMKSEKSINLAYLANCATVFDYNKVKSKYIHKQSSRIGF